jgi:hypothetical protein
MNDNALTNVSSEDLLHHIQEQRQDIQRIHTYLQSTGLEYSWIGLATNVTHDERPIYEQDGEEFYNQTILPMLPPTRARPYLGFLKTEGFRLVRQDDLPFYFPIHYVAPQRTVYFDLVIYAKDFLLKPVMDEALEIFAPVLSRRIFTNPTSGRYAVLLLHPGTPVPDDPIASQPRDIAVISIVINSLLAGLGRALSSPPHVSVYLYDTKENATHPAWLGGVHFDCKGYCSEEDEGEMIFYNETSLADVRRRENSGYYDESLDIGNREWKVVILGGSGEFQADLSFLVLGAVMILLACAMYV